MPEIKLKHIVSFSSEDKVHKAENLIKPETYRKWKCATPGEKNASVVVQFEKASQIHSIDIGNESSAFVEVLVGRSSDSVSDFQVLLVASSFMSPIESRNESHTNRVRMFGPEKLAQNLKDEKWDCVQIVCTQPFNKNITYGLTFIKFHSPPEKIEERPKVTEKAASKIGVFTIRNEDDDDSLPSVGSFFGKKKTQSSESPSSSQELLNQSLANQSYASAVLASSQSPKTSPESSASKRKLDQSTESEDTTAKKKISRLEDPPAKKRNSKSDDPPAKRKSSKSEDPPAKKSPTILNNDFITYKDVDVRLSPKRTPRNREREKESKPFNKIMSKVVFVLSGFVNPLRSQIRDKALEMGAKYKGDWDNSCTHLICAFLNTPKYTQVRASDGRIVSKDWILDCHKRKTLLPWRMYMLGKYSKDTTSESSSSEEEEEPVRIKPKKASPAQSPKKRATENNPKSTPSKAPVLKEKAKIETTVDDSETEDDETLADYMADTDVDTDSGDDTEDELRKAEIEIRKKKDAKNSEKVNGNSPDCSPPRKPDVSDLPLPELPNLFKQKHFYLYGKFSPSVHHDIQRFITAYNGVIDDYMGDTVKYIITECSWDKNFDEAIDKNEDLVFVKPQWIYKCHESGKFVPYHPFLIVPDT